jgi:acyl-CoA synthetase (AMP-forming)/AMP-acid ligase II
MIKTSGYRVSPTEIEEVVSATGLVNEVIAVGVPDEALGQAIVVVATPPAGGAIDAEQVIGRCRESLPHFMVPHHVVTRSSLPRNPNGKIDRLRVAKELQLDRQEVS